VERIRTAGLCATAAGLIALGTTGVAGASTTVPFRIDPASFGNPHGSFDVPPLECVAVVDEQPGTVRISGGKPEGWGCLIFAEVNWLNLSTGASGTARTSDGLHGFPPEAVIDTGSGQVVLVLRPAAGVVTPGFATFYVP